MPTVFPPELLNTVVNMPCQDFFTKIPDNSVHTVFTSPPYNRLRNDKYNHYVDNTPWLELLSLTVEESFRVLDDGFLFLNIQRNYYNKKQYYEFIGKYAPYLVDEIIWMKNNPMPASGRNVTNSYEAFFVLHEKAKALKATHTYTLNSFKAPVNPNTDYRKVHRAVMSTEVGAKIFSDFIGHNASTESKVILDPFMGVGTTAILAHRFGYDFAGCDLSPEYTALANERIANNATIERPLF